MRTGKDPILGPLYGVRSFQLHSISANSEANGIGFLEISVLHRPIRCRIERVTLTSRDVKLMSSHLSASSSPTRSPLVASRNQASRQGSLIFERRTLDSLRMLRMVGIFERLAL